MTLTTENTEIKKSTYSIPYLGSRRNVVKLQSFGYVFIGILAKGRLPHITTIEIYHIEDGLEMFQGYAEGKLFQRLAGPMLRASGAHKGL